MAQQVGSFYLFVLMNKTPSISPKAYLYSLCFEIMFGFVWAPPNTGTDCLICFPKVPLFSLSENDNTNSNLVH